MSDTLTRWMTLIFSIVATIFFAFNASKLGSLRQTRTLTRQEEERFPSVNFLYISNIILAIISALIGLIALFYIFTGAGQRRRAQEEIRGGLGQIRRGIGGLGPKLPADKTS